MPPKRSLIPTAKGTSTKRPKKTPASKAASSEASRGSSELSAATRKSTTTASKGSSTNSEDSSESSAVPVPKPKKIRIALSNVHKEFDQVLSEDSNGNKLNCENSQYIL